MTRETVCRYLNAIMNCVMMKATLDDYCIKLRGCDAKQRAEIERLTALAKQYHDTAENKNNDIEQLRAERDEYRSLNEHHKEQFLKVNLELATAKQEITRLREALSDLHAQVQGECPSLLNEDSGGDAKLALEITSLLTEAL